MTTPARLPRLLPLTPQYRERVWGGHSLHPSGSGTPIGEAWIAYGQSVVSAGAVQGQTLDELLLANGTELLGDRAVARTDAQAGFPLLIKLLDCADWLSVQVHPNDVQARGMVGPGERGKTEAWHMLQATPDAEILAGVKAGTTPEELAQAIRGGTVLEVAERHSVVAGDTVFIPANTLHALGPGLLLYEVQQSSDTTYRVYDWDRSMSAGRALHLEESVAVTDPALHGDLRPQSQTHGQGELTASEYFVLEGVKLVGTGDTYRADTRGESFQIVTVTAGEAELSSGSETLRLATFQTALVSAAAGAYGLEAVGGAATVLLAGLPE
ncbi:type I phosphomannose isomerase catalytic subunit [Deinococcus altitudinis]|uniref:type I phosphomannose isomerase catalytic subunit n=1 Tax=Deinococcus altitudinis TaxID=468914 RepID=UPI0038924876